MSVDSPTRQQPVPPPPPPKRTGFNVVTLIIAAIASVVAAIVVSHFWQSGTLWATAMTPVIVALVKEALERPAQRISTVTVATRPRHDPDDLVVEEVEPGPVPTVRPQPAGYKAYGLRPKHWRLALVTGLLAFVLGALILTVPELVAGRSIVHGSEKTSLFGGRSKSVKPKAPKQATQTQTVTTTVPSTTTTPTQTTTTPQQTTTTPPAQTTTAPQGTTTTPPSGGQTTPTVPAP